VRLYSQRGELIAVCIGWATTTALLLHAAMDALSHQPTPQSPQSVGIETRPLPATATVDELGTAARLVSERDPFRVDRHAAQTAYSPNIELSEGNIRSSSAARPTLQLRGTIGGPPWQALLEGLPEHAGSLLVREGSAFGSGVTLLVVKRIREDSVVVRGVDTTWTLLVKRAW